MRKAKQFFCLTFPVIMVGFRQAVVRNIGIAAIGSYIGAGGLGELIVTGLAVRVMQLTLQGAASTAALAIILEALFGALEDVIAPRGIRIMKQDELRQ